MMVQN